MKNEHEEPSSAAQHNDNHEPWCSRNSVPCQCQMVLPGGKAVRRRTDFKRLTRQLVSQLRDPDCTGWTCPNCGRVTNCKPITECEECAYDISELIQPAANPALDVELIRQRIKLAQRMFGVRFDGYPDIPREAVDIQRDRDRSALLREVERLLAEVARLAPLTAKWRDEGRYGSAEYRDARNSCASELEAVVTALPLPQTKVKDEPNEL